MKEEEKQAIKVLNFFNPTDCGIEEVQAIETILNLVEKQQKIIEGIVDLMYYTNEYPENIYCMIEDLLKEYGIERKYLGE